MDPSIVCFVPFAALFLGAVGVVFVVVVRAMAKPSASGDIDALRHEIERHTTRLTQLEASLARTREELARVASDATHPPIVSRPPPSPGATPHAEPVREVTFEDATRKPANVAPTPSLPFAPRVASPVTAPPVATQPAIESPVPALPASAPPVPRVESGSFEQWIGVRGAAVLGAAVLVLAGVFFFRYTIELGLLTETIRVGLGLALGLSMIGVAELLLRKRYEALANGTSGAGAAILYLTIWAARAGYGLIETSVAMPLFCAITALTCVLATKRKSPAIAALGLAGGFATPYLLSSGSDNAIALFSYLVLLDVALLFVARRQRWPWLAIFALAGTAMYQGLWLLFRMDPGELGLGVAIAMVFAPLFAIGAGARSLADAEGDDLVWSIARVLGMVVPFCAAFVFVMRADLGPSFLPTAVLLAPVTVGAAILARLDRNPLLGPLAAGSSLGTVAAFIATRSITTQEGAILAASIAFVAITLAVVARTTAPRSELTHANILASGLGILVTVQLGWAAPGAMPIAIVLSLCLAGLLAAEAYASKSTFAAFTGPVLGALAIGSLHGAASSIPHWLFALVILAVAFGSQIVAAYAPQAIRRALDHGGGVGIAVLAGHYVSITEQRPLSLLVLLGLALAATMVASRRKHGGYLLATFFVMAFPALAAASGEPSRAVAPGIIALVLFGSLVPALLAPRLRGDSWTFRAMALAPVLFYPACSFLGDRLGFEGYAGVIPLALGVVALLSFALARRVVPEGSPSRKSSLVWLAASAALLFAFALPVQLENEALTVGLAIYGLLAALLYRRVDHLGLKLLAGATFGVVTARLLLNPEVLVYHPPSPIPFVSWLTYTYLVPTLCLVAAHFAIRGVEVSRFSAVERSVFAATPALSRALFVAALAVFFAWINLSIFEAFAEGSALTIPLDRLPARDLSLSLAWALYGLAILVLGLVRGNVGLRATGLALAALTCAKVFLYDLAFLSDLYRVASLVCLGVLLFLISFAYQRMVLRAKEAPLQVPGNASV